MTAPSGLGLKPDPEFTPTERLYRRIGPEHIDEQNHVMGGAVEDITDRHPSCSFNREKYSNPEDVLDSNKPAMNRIACLVAGDLPAPVPHPLEPNKKYEFRLEHLPEEDNYSHTEVQVTKEGEGEIVNGLSNRILRRDLREKLAEKMFVLPC